MFYSVQIKGLPEALKDPDSLVASNYSPETVQKTFANMRRFRGGNAIFTFPPMPIKCPGAPQKIMYLADDYWRKVSLCALSCYLQMLSFLYYARYYCMAENYFVYDKGRLCGVGMVIYQTRLYGKVHVHLWDTVLAVFHTAINAMK